MIQQKAIDKQSIYLRIQIVAHSDTTEEQFALAKAELNSALSDFKLEFVTADPLAIFFLSGGTERRSIEAIGEKTHVILLAFARDNAYASASEVKAFLNNKGTRAWLCNLSDSKMTEQLKWFVSVWTRVRGFTHKRLGLIGKVSDWLVYSDPKPDLLRTKFGIRLRVFPWSDFPAISTFHQSPEYLEFYSGNGDPQLERHSRIHFLIEQVIDENKLDGIAVECFSLVQSTDDTACLSLAFLNHKGIPSACEGDLVSLTGMLLIKHIIGLVPWMANLSGLYSNFVEFSHCTISPEYLKDYKLMSHFETGKGLAISGELEHEIFTIFRWDQNFEYAFIASGKKIEQEWKSFSCRTQLSLELSTSEIQKLQNSPLGNHHLILPGNYTHILQIACEYLNITII